MPAPAAPARIEMPKAAFAAMSAARKAVDAAIEEALYAAIAADGPGVADGAGRIALDALDALRAIRDRMDAALAGEARE
jgi:hypothetical protein